MYDVILKLSFANINYLFLLSKFYWMFFLFTKVSHPLKPCLFSFTFACGPPYPLSFNTCLIEVMQTIHILHPVFPTLQPFTRILLISLSLSQIVAIRCWGVTPSVSPKTRRMRSIQARTRFHNVSAMRSPSMSEKSSPRV